MAAVKKIAIDRSNFIYRGLALAAFFGWLLSFPMFGKLLMETAGERALLLGLLFVISHGLGFLISALLSAKRTASRIPARIAGTICAALTVTYAFIHGEPMADIFIMALLGLSAAYIVSGWTVQFSLNDRPIETLAVAMAGANIVTALVNMPVQIPEKLPFFLLAAIALAGVFTFGSTDIEETGKKAGPREPGMKKTVSTMIIPLAAYSVAIYLIGGIWYNTFSLQLAASPLWESSIGFLLYSGGIIVWALPAKRGQPGNLAPYSLSLLGVGLVIALTRSDNSFLVWVHHAAPNLGFAAADLFFWYALWTVARYYPGRRVFGFGLGASLLLIGLSTAISAVGWAYGFPVLVFITALTLLFLIVPMISRNPFRMMNLSVAGSEGVADTPVPPGNLTPAESKIYLLLMQGASDSEMAEALFISRHTVKFHVRNILRKLEVKNRKELFLRSTAKQHAPGIMK